jgi:hypothetical protein
MESFTVMIADPVHVAGITAARAAYNAQCTQDTSVLSTNDEYVQLVVARAAGSYAKQYGVVGA